MVERQQRANDSGVSGNGERASGKSNEVSQGSGQRGNGTGDPGVRSKLVTELRSLKEAALLATARAKAADARYGEAVVVALAEAGAPIETSAICLDCGEIRSAAHPNCSCRAVNGNGASKA